MGVKGPLHGEHDAYPVLHQAPAGTRLTNAVRLPGGAQPCSGMAVLSAGNNRGSLCLFLTSLFTSKLPEKQTLNLQDRLAQRWLCLCVQSRMEPLANRTLTSLLCFCSSIELFLSRW